MAVIARASLVEYFKVQVEAALAAQQVPASEDTAHYVVQLLADTVRQDLPGRAAALLDPRPLALRLADALDERCPAPGRALRDVADAALLLGGYFKARASAHGLPSTYYHRLGGFAFFWLGRLWRRGHNRRNRRGHAIAKGGSIATIGRIKIDNFA